MLKMFPWMILLMSIMMSISSNSWLNIWILMEMNSMTFIFMMCQSKELMKKDSPIKYFLIQTVASCILLNMFLININKNINYSLVQFSMMIIIITIIMALKMGMAPIHMWMMPISKSLNWIMLLTMLTIQKVIPIFVMMSFSKNMMMMILSSMSITMGTLSQMNNIMSKIILTFSSISHLGWMMMVSKMNFKTTWLYLLIYSMISMVTFYIMKNMNIDMINKQINKKYKYMVMITMMSLAGIPPLLGFLPKWSIFYTMILNKMSLMIIIMMLIMSSINFYVYMKFSLNSILKWKNKSSKKIFISKTYFINMMLPILMIHLKK